MKSKTESGNVLFIILVAIALFAALSFAISNMMRSGNAEAISEQRASILADEILAYARDIRQTVQNLRISNGCEPEDISFENSVVAGYTHSPVADDKCKVFHPSGGGLSYIKPVEDWLDGINTSHPVYGIHYFTGHSCVNDVGESEPGIECRNATPQYAELILYIPFVNQALCQQLAKKTGVLRPNENIPIEYVLTWPSSNPKFVGVYNSANVLGNYDGADNSETLHGRLNGCFEASGSPGAPPSGTYHFYQVLIPR